MNVTIINKMWKDYSREMNGGRVTCNKCGSLNARSCMCAKKRWIQTITDAEIKEYQTTHVCENAKKLCNDMNNHYC